MAEHEHMHDDMVRRIADGSGVSPNDNPIDYDALQNTWDVTAESSQPSADVDAAWDRLERRLSLNKRKKARIVFLRTAVAASIVLAMVLVFRPTGPSERIVLANAGEQITSTLDDGSQVQLNSDTRLAWSYSGDIRQVSLSGEAFFDVATSDTPFIIQTENATVEVLGTQFNVLDRGYQTEVFVEEGRVSVSNASGSVILVAGESAVSRPDTGVAKDSLQTSATLAWRAGGFGFVRSPLANVVAELERRFGVTIAIENEELITRSVTATFPELDIRTVLESVCLTLDCTVEGDGPYTIR